jgi:hypothetical protein
MSENEANKNVRNDEIDLLDLFRRMGKTINHWVHALGRAFLISVVFLLKRWIPLGLSIIAGVTVSFLTRSIKPALYTSDMTLKSNFVPCSEMINYINKLNTFSKEGNIPALSDALSIEFDTNSCYLVDIGAFWIIDEKHDDSPDYVDYENSFDYDSSNVRIIDQFDIRVRVSIPQKLPAIRDGILSYINNNAFFQRRNKVRLKLNEDMLARLNYDIYQLDSLQKIKYYVETMDKKSQVGGQMIFLQEQKTQLLYSDIYSLYSRKQDLESEMALKNEIVTLMSDFSMRTQRENGTLSYAKIIIPLFFSITLLILIIISNWHKLKEIYNKY